jgi:hypothetical protein
VLTTANATGTNGLTCLPKHGGARDNNFLVAHPMAEQHCLNSAIALRSAQTAGPSSSSHMYVFRNVYRHHQPTNVPTAEINLRDKKIFPTIH